MTPREEAEQITALIARLLVLADATQPSRRAKCEAERADNRPCFAVHPDRPELWCSPCYGIELTRALRQAADALRAAEARGEQRGRVQGLRDAEREMRRRTMYVQDPLGAIADWLRARADALDQPHTETRKA